jgi:hypothetical protein
MLRKRYVRSLYSDDASDRTAPTQRPHKQLILRSSNNPLTYTSSSPKAVFPLPLFALNKRISRTKWKAHPRANRDAGINQRANLAIQALNTLHFNFPNDHNMNYNTFSLSPLSTSRDRLLTNIRQSAQSHYLKSHEPGQPDDDKLLESVLRLTDTSSLFIRINDTALSTPVSLPNIDAMRCAVLPHIATPMIYGPSPAIAPLICNRVSLPTRLANLSILQHLPAKYRQMYATESPALVLTASQYQERLRQWKLDGRSLPSAKIHGQRSEYIKLVKLMLSIGMLSLTDTPRVVNGIFTVKKDDDTDRLIIDARFANAWFTKPPKTALPTPAHVVQLRLPEMEQLLIGKADLSNYYHHLQLPEWLRPFLALPSLTAAELGLDNGPSDRLIFPCCTTLPMGWSHSVRIAQLIHENILYEPHGDTPAALRPEDNILHVQHPDIVRPLHALYVDDSIMFGLASDPDETKRQYNRMLAAYASVGLPVKESKCIYPDAVRTVTALGMDVNGLDGTVSISSGRHYKMILATVHLLWKERVTGHAVSVVVGLWTWNLLLRRPALSALKCCYSFIERHRWSEAELWPSVRRELITLIGLAPLLHTSLRYEWYQSVMASDASTMAAGVVATAFVEGLVHQLWPSTLSALLFCTTDDLVTDEGDHLEETGGATTESPSTTLTLKSDHHWSTIISYPWRKDEHINALELRAVILAVRWVLSHPSSARKRVMLLVDSAVVYYILRKGRSSSSHLLSVYRRLSSLLLASGLSVTPIWVPSAANPADAPSRLVIMPDADGA